LPDRFLLVSSTAGRLKRDWEKSVTVAMAHKQEQSPVDSLGRSCACKHEQAKAFYSLYVYSQGVSASPEELA
jgi:predicted solute-binding protein